jgi:hypothetical protein
MSALKIGAVGAAVALLGPLAVHAQTLDLPARRPGLWETQMVIEKPKSTPAITSRMCIDAATDREMMEFGLKMSRNNCKRFDIRRLGGSWVIDADCTIGPRNSTTKTTITGDFQSAMTIRIEGSTDGMLGPGGGSQFTLITQTSTWKAASCGNDLKPGDVSIGNGMKMNVRQLRELQKALPNIQIK